MSSEKEVEYIDGRPVPRYKISGRPEMIELAKKGAISWEYGAFTEASNADEKTRGRTWENEYLNRKDKIAYTKASFDAYEKYCELSGKTLSINSDSKVIEFGSAMGRNLVEAYNRYECHAVGVDICQEVVDKCNDRFVVDGQRIGDFYKDNLRNNNFLEQYEDDYFELGICDAFLMCIAAGEDKKSLISEITRICKSVWFHEMLGDLQDDYGEANGVQSGEDLNVYDNRLIRVLDPRDADTADTLEGNTMYYHNRPKRSPDSRFYVYKK